MSGVNRVYLIGNLGRDPEIKHLNGDTSVCNFSIATSEKWKDKQTGEMQEKTEWHRIVAWRRLAEICNQYLHKGSQVYIEGKLQTRSWEQDDGTTRYMTEVVANTVQFLGGRSDSGGSGNNGDGNRNGRPEGEADWGGSSGKSNNGQPPPGDDIPF